MTSEQVQKRDQAIKDLKSNLEKAMKNAVALAKTGQPNGFGIAQSIIATATNVDVPFSNQLRAYMQESQPQTVIGKGSRFGSPPPPYKRGPNEVNENPISPPVVENKPVEPQGAEDDDPGKAEAVLEVLNFDSSELLAEGKTVDELKEIASKLGIDVSRVKRKESLAARVFHFVENLG